MQAVFTADIEQWYDGIVRDGHMPIPLSNRLEKGLLPMLDLLDKYSIKSTLFWLADTARANPLLIKECKKRGHEIGLHSLDHVYFPDLSFKEAEYQVSQGTHIVQDLIGCSIKGFRAPYFSILQKNLWLLEILASHGYEYDSSIMPFRHYRYGIPGSPYTAWNISTSSGMITEIPISVSNFIFSRIPVSGGAYFRLYPLSLSLYLMNKFFKTMNSPAIFYLHPWELDAEHPKVEIKFPQNILHYYNLKGNILKIDNLLNRVEWLSMDEYRSQSQIAGQIII